MAELTIVGNMTAPVELRYTGSGKAVGSVTVAVNRKRGDQEFTDFYRVTLWESLAENAAQLDKGTRVIVHGRFESREYETKDGEKRTAWELTADAFGPDLRFATAQVTRVTGGVSRGQAPAADPWAAQGAGAVDAWGSAGYGDDSPF